MSEQLLSQVPFVDPAICLIDIVKNCFQQGGGLRFGQVHRRDSLRVLACIEWRKPGVTVSRVWFVVASRTVVDPVPPSTCANVQY